VKSVNFVKPQQSALPLKEQKVNGGALDMPTGSPVTSGPLRIRMMVTPEQAEQWLASANHRNRPLMETHALRIAMDIDEGRWKYQGDAIRFAVDGSLLDGQHRLKAVAIAGKPIDTDVVLGLPLDVMDCIDTGCSIRTAAQVSGLRGLHNSAACCAIAALLLVHKKHGIERMNNPRFNPTKTQVIDAALHLPGISEAATVSTRKGLSKLCAPSRTGFCYYLFARQDKVAAERFFAELASGSNLSTTNPAYHLRERLVDNVADKAKLSALHVIALFFRAWINYRNGKPMRILKTWKTDGPSPEKFPDIGPVEW
jgi:hypothetical protein